MTNKQGFKELFKKTWRFIWDDDSIWSWILNVLLAFVIIKFLVYPGLGLMLGTDYPIVAVVSGSMEHDGSFDEWWNSPAFCTFGKSGDCKQKDNYLYYGISKEHFLDYPLKNGFNKGDIIVLKGADVIEIGDIIVFQSYFKSEPIIHRVVKMENNIYQTKGDHNFGSSKYDNDIKDSQVIGKAWFKIPFFGWIKILFTQFMGFFGIHIA